MKILVVTALLITVGVARADVVVARLDPSSMLDHRAEAVEAASSPLHDAVDLASVASDYLTVLVACALPADATATIAGIDYVGGDGLAPDWASRGLDREERRRVTACALTQLSGRQVAIPISIRGPGLSASLDEREAWTIDEGAFFGDALSPGAPQLLACRGVTGGLSLDRVCAEPGATPGQTMCGLTFAGECADVCRRDRAGRYHECRSPFGRTSAVVTVFLHP